MTMLLQTGLLQFDPETGQLKDGVSKLSHWKYQLINNVDNAVKYSTTPEGSEDFTLRKGYLEMLLDPSWVVPNVDKPFVYSGLQAPRLPSGEDGDDQQMELDGCQTEPSLVQTSRYSNVMSRLPVNSLDEIHPELKNLATQITPYCPNKLIAALLHTTMEQNHMRHCES